MDRETLKRELKELIIFECDKEDDVSVSDITDAEQLVGSDAPLALDSLDVLQLSLAVKSAYKVRIEGAVDARQAFASIDALADYILERQNNG